MARPAQLHVEHALLNRVFLSNLEICLLPAHLNERPSGWMMDGEEMLMDPHLEDPADASNHNTGENGEEVEEDHLGYNPQLNGAYDPQLRDDRVENKYKLRRRFEHIFEKYERDFEGIGDEIDLATGEIVVDNGHLQNMRNEHDAGDRANSEAVVSSVEDSDVNESEEEFGDDEDGESDGDSIVGDVSNGNLAGLYAGAESSTSLFEADESAQESDLENSLGHAMHSTTADVRNVRPPRDRSASAASSVSGTPSDNNSSHNLPENLLEQVPGLKDSMLAVQSNYKDGKTMDPVAIHNLGISIANQLAAFISRGDGEKQKRKSKRKRDSTWSPPPLPADQASKRQRSHSPQPEVAEPPSVEKKSIWAPIRHPRQQKQRRVKERQPTQPAEPVENDGLSASEDNTSVQPSPRRTRDGKVRTCNNCGTSDSNVWRKGPNGVLCNTCGMYVYRYGMMRPVGPALEGDVPMTRGDDPITPEATEGEDDPLERDWWLGLDSGKKKEKIKPVGVRNSHFVIDEDALIIKLKEIDLLSWERMATHFPGRSAYALQCRYSKRLHSSAPEARNLLLEQGYKGTPNDKGVIVFSYTREVFKEEEDELLLKLRDEDGLEWDVVAASLPGRTQEVLEQRYNELARKYLGLDDDDPKQKGGQKQQTKESSYPQTKSLRYSAEEDAMIVKLREVDQLNWASVADYMEGRNSFSLQKRYIRELCGRHPDSICEPRKAYGRATPSRDITRVEGYETDTGPDLHDSSGSPTQLFLRNGSPLIRQDYPTNDEGVNATYESGAAESWVDTTLALTASHFTDAEDTLIIKLREVEGLPWEAVAAYLPNRDVSLISERYYHYLHSKAARPTAGEIVRQQPPSPAASTASAPKNRDAGKRWTEDESLLAEILRKQGKSWSEIATHLPGRTAAAVKSRFGAMFDPNKKAYQQRVNRNSTGNSKSQAPLLRQAVNNLRRRSMSALSFEDEDGRTAAFSDELSGQRDQSGLRPLLPKMLPNEAGKLARRPAEELQGSQSDPHRILGGLVDNPASMSAPRPVQVVGQPDGHRHIYPDTPARGNFVPSSPIGVTPVAAALYATPARYHQQVHPYFLPPPPPLSSPYPLLNGQLPVKHRSELEKEPSVAKAARPLPAPKAKSSKRAPKAASQSKAKAPIQQVGKKAGRKSTAARKSPSPSEDSSDDEDMTDYNPSENDSANFDEPSDDASDSDFVEALPTSKTRRDAQSAAEHSDQDHLDNPLLRVAVSARDGAVDRVSASFTNTNKPDRHEALEDGEAVRDPENALRSKAQTGQDVNSAQGLNTQTVSKRSEAVVVDTDTSDEQVDESLPTIDSSLIEDDEASKPERPKFTYTEMATMALKSSAPEPLTTSQVCEFMRANFEYFRLSKAAWHTSVHNTLRRGSQFREESGNGRLSWTLLDTSSIEKAGRTTSSEARALSGKATLEPAADGTKDGASGQGDSEVKIVTKRKYRPRKPKIAGEDKTQLPDVPRRGPGRPRIHPMGPKRPRGRPPKNRSVVTEQFSSSMVKGPDEIPNSDVGDLHSSQDMLMDATPSQDLDSSAPDLPMLDDDDDARKPTDDSLQSTLTASEPSDVVRSQRNSSSDIAREPQSEPDSSNRQGLDEPSLMEDSSELSIRTNEALATSSPIISKRASPSKKYGRASTPGTGSSTLFSHSKQQRVVSKPSPMKATTPSVIPRIRSIVEPFSRKRIVFTPARDFDDSEDELAL